MDVCHTAEGARIEVFANLGEAAEAAPEISLAPVPPTTGLTGHDVLIDEAVQDYVQTVLPGKPDEDAVLGVDTEEIPIRAQFDRSSADRR